ncbi:hypothetical protein [Flectobacillus major]|jgi:Spy/CpxP family protein refolding chaperone|uniref:hypothetical protein n=1 Tax=Flectobacillus major TaxID=103 RepID=UPI000425D681|nr:hypothetical protein [Flectobacillus major]
MKITKGISVLALSLILAGGVAFQSSAQDTDRQMDRTDKTPEERASNQVKQLSKKLGLTADQQAQLTPLVLERVKKREAIRQASNKRAALKELSELANSQEEKIKGILTPEQFTQFKDLQEDAKDNVKGKMRRSF